MVAVLVEQRHPGLVHRRLRRHGPERPRGHAWPPARPRRAPRRPRGCAGRGRSGCPGGSPRTSTDEMRSSRMARAASTTVASGPTQTGGPRTSRPASAERSGWKAATGDCSRLARSRSPSPAAKWAAKRGSSSSRRKSAARERAGDEILLDHDVERGLARDERGVAEGLPLLEHLHRLAVALEPDRALPDDVEVLHGLAAGAGEPGAGGEPAFLGSARRLLEALAGQRVEGRDRPQEAGRVHGSLAPRRSPSFQRATGSVARSGRKSRSSRGPPTIALAKGTSWASSGDPAIGSGGGKS